MKVFTLLLFFVQSISLHSQDLHFHQTGGFGTDKMYGLEGEVYRVTNLNKEGEGSLKYFLELSGPRIIVFEVGGVIDLDGDVLSVTNGQVTVAGQTAPYPGIHIIKGSLRVKADDVLIQHLTIRPGDAGYSEPVGWEPDGFAVSKGNVVFDHCSVSWAIDENMSVARGGNNVTFYRCIVAEGLSNSIHGKGEHSCGTLVMFDSKNISVIGGLYAHNFRRHPRMVNGSTVLWANNIIYNWGIYASHIGANVGVGDPNDPGIGDFIGNAYFKGTDSWDDIMVESHKGDFDKNNPPAVGKAYLEDNMGLDRLTGGSLISSDGHVTLLTESAVKPEAFIPNSAYENIELVLKNAGARPFERSDIDTRIVQSLIDGTGSVIDSQEEVGGYPEYDSTWRAIPTIPLAGDERRLWLDSISTSLGTAVDLDVSSLYNFVDENLATSTKAPQTVSMQYYPNPVSRNLNINFRLNQEEVIDLSIVDMMGRKINLISSVFEAGLHSRVICFGDTLIPDGIYMLSLSDGKQTLSENIVVRQ